MLELLSDPNAWAALVTLTVLEIVLGIDNLVFISVLVARLEEPKATRTRQLGLALALIFRVLLLFAITTLMKLREPLFAVFGAGISWHDIILIGGGLFLLAKATHEIHGEIDAREHDGGPTGMKPVAASVWLISLQVVAVDAVFSIDSILTAIGMAEDIEVMIAAVIIAIAFMYFLSGPTSDFISKHPTSKMLALAFLLLIGVALIADGFDFHIPRGYIYFAMAFAGAVEVFNVAAGRKRRRRNANQ
jgi:predicted tellurium resistance membrane protein TerC